MSSHYAVTAETPNVVFDPEASATPTAHATTHASGGSDPVTPASIGAIAEALLSFRGDLLVRSASAVAALGLGAARYVLSSDGTDVLYQQLASLLDDVGAARGMILRRGASAWQAVAAETADTFLGGDGTDVGVRTAAQVRASLGLGAVTATGADAAAALAVLLPRRPVDGSTVACWRCDDGTAATSLAEASAGTALAPLSTPTWTPGYTAGLYSHRPCVLFEGPTGASAARFEAAITMPAGDFTLEFDCELYPWHTITLGASQTDLLSLNNGIDYAGIRWSWSGTSGLMAYSRPTGKSEIDTPTYAIASLIGTRRHHVMASFVTTTGTINLYVDAHLVATVTSAPNVGGMSGSGWKLVVGNPSNTRVPAMAFGEVRISGVARAQAYALAATTYLLAS